MVPPALPVSDELAAALAELLPVGGGERPDEVRGWPASSRTWKKIVAFYPNGWKLTVNFKRNGEVSSCSAGFRMVGQIKGKAA